MKAEILLPGQSEFTQFLANVKKGEGRVLTNGTLRHEDYIKWDQKLVEVARTKLTFIQDMVKYNLVRRDYNLGDIVAKWEKVSDMTAASVSMDGMVKGQNDRLTFTETGVPIPIFRKDFGLGQRTIEASRERGQGLPTEQISTCGRLVRDSVEDMFWNGVPTIVMDGLQVYGLTNFPSRNTKSISNTWGGGSGTPIADVLDMVSKARADKFYGPYSLYVASNLWTTIQQDYSTLKGDKTVYERLLAIPDIESVREGYGLDNGEVVLVQMTEDVIDLAVAQDFTNFEQPRTDTMWMNVSVMAAMALRCKADINGNCGIVHATGA